MSEYRQDGTTGTWVVIAPELNRRPLSRGPAIPHPASRPAHDDACPFCPGNERLLPPIIEQTAAEGGSGWATRVVPNKHPALQPKGDIGPLTMGHQLRLAGFGYHELIIESPRHGGDLLTFTDAELAAVIRTWQARHRELSARPGIEATFVYRRFGPCEDARYHPHSQAIATAIVPPWVAAQTRWAHERYDQDGQCATCGEVGHEASDGQRVIEATQQFLVAVPFAAKSPYELRITPFRHRPSFTDASAVEVMDLIAILRRSLARLRDALGHHTCNLTIGSAASHSLDPASDHWSLSIVPDLLRRCGFELGSGLPVNPSRPEEDAAILRSARIG